MQHHLNRNGLTGGSSAFGNISPTGSYTAPASLPTPATVMVTATSAALNSASASSAVTLTNPSVYWEFDNCAECRILMTAAEIE